jgi:aryl-alcohol dehydrogenase-like predicted oxidoreductase
MTMNYTRREFIKTGVAAGIGAMLPMGADAAGQPLAPAFFNPYEKVELGKTGITTTLLAMGTGMHGYNHRSDVTRMGHDKAVQLVRKIYESGVRFFDTADQYGTHFIISEALSIYPRSEYTVNTKIWPYPGNGQPRANMYHEVDRFLKELKMEYVDSLLLHCLRDGKWRTEMSDYMEALDKLKQDGKIRAHGVSCHSLDALKEAVKENWVDIVLARINPYGAKMDGTADEVYNVVKQLHQAGRGVMAMKVFGEGEFANDPAKRSNSLKYILQSGYVDVLDIGMLKMSDLTDTAERISKVEKKKA